MRARKQAVHQLPVGARRCIRLKGDRLLRTRRQAGEIQRQPPDKLRPIRRASGGEPLVLEPLLHKGVHRAALPLGDLRPLRRKEGPVPGVFGPLLDPQLEEVLFRL